MISKTIAYNGVHNIFRHTHFRIDLDLWTSKPGDMPRIGAETQGGRKPSDMATKSDFKTLRGLSGSQRNWSFFKNYNPVNPKKNPPSPRAVKNSGCPGWRPRSWNVLMHWRSGGTWISYITFGVWWIHIYIHNSVYIYIYAIHIYIYIYEYYIYIYMNITYNYV